MEIFTNRCITFTNYKIKKICLGTHSQRNYDYKEYQFSDYRLPNWPQLCLSGTHAVLTSMSSMTFQDRESYFFSSSKLKLKSQNMYLRNVKKNFKIYSVDPLQFIPQKIAQFQASRVEDPLNFAKL